MDSQVEEQRAQGQEEELTALCKDIWSVCYEARIPSRLPDLCSVYPWRAVHVKDLVCGHELFG